MSEDQQKSRLKQEIDSNLKRVYDTVLQEDIPDRFKDLLAQLRAKDSQREQK
ncbi:NepR family anti-sigma factor [Szabonella alba]|uniref:Transcriptional regulator n=1 Tax=Szabonella alba TaxID=2804194 RepID=A0A8K0V987_9RHOB|nr:NepR family anti-sigma factor [Szabonella alba]MBL4915725.1 transcriptional regulator [Szabonella alba]